MQYDILTPVCGQGDVRRFLRSEQCRLVFLDWLVSQGYIEYICQACRCPMEYRQGWCSPCSREAERRIMNWKSS